MWVCDGCTARFDHPESIEALAHYLDNRNPECWGLMKVGGPAHKAFLKGQHPMQAVVATMEADLLDSGLIVAVLR